MAKEPPSLGELEIHVLRWIWQEQPCTGRQLWDLIREKRSGGRTTVLKTIQRLEAGDLLVRVAGEGPVQFRAAVEKKRLLPAIVRRFVDRTLLRRRDLVWCWIPQIARMLFFFNPAAHLVWHRIRLESALGCDQQAMRSECGTLADYVQTLLLVMRRISGPPQLQRRSVP